MSTLYELYLEATSTNTTYNEYQDRWHFYLQSYEGGDEYRRSGHLTRYVNESDSEYSARLASTPLDNHCRSVVSVYTSFLFRKHPDRDLGSIQADPMLEDFLRDADLDGRSLDQFMKEVSIWSNVFGHAFVLVTKPNLGAVTRADELAQGVRPYVSLLTPLTVFDWSWKRSPMGRYTLDMIKYVEDVNGDEQVIKQWTPEEIVTWTVNTKDQEMVGELREPNGLGYVPAVIAYGNRGAIRGIGVSDLSDIADHQKKIYNELSEVEQSIRLNGHPTVVKTPDVEMSAGAGSVALMPDGLDPGLKPYMLNVSTDISAIYNSIEHSIGAIDKMANTGAVRATESRTLSGVAMRTEFELLNAKLSEKADNLELAEEQIWKLYAVYQGLQWDGEVEYPDSFNIQDETVELQKLQIAKATATDPVVFRVIDGELLELMGKEKEYLPFVDPNPQPGRTYPDGEAIPDSLPAAYQDSANPEVPQGQNCGNCQYYKAGEMYCYKFDAPVREIYWCAKWEAKEIN
jgi:hypothetical protein